MTNEENVPHKTSTIIVNGRPKEVSSKVLSFGDVVRLAFDPPPSGENTLFTVSYKRGHGDKPEGTMVEGGTVKVKEGMIFNVTATNKS